MCRFRVLDERSLGGRQCVDDGACTDPDTGVLCNWNRSGRYNHPINCVDWNQALSFCQWAGGRLPSEAEWEYAARSGGQDIEYPWGDQKPTPDLCHFGGDAGGTTPVGRYSPQGNSPYGCVDMAGNVWEWTASDYSKDQKVLRGGSWLHGWGHVRAFDRDHLTPDDRSDLLGFRCVGLPGE